MPRTKFKEIRGKEYIGEIDYDIEVNNGRSLRLNLIYLEEKYRHRGYGKVIMKDIIKKAKRLGCKSILIDLTKPTYDYYLTYEERKKFFKHFGFKFDKGGDFARLDLK